MKQADPEIYAGVSRAERRRLARDLQKLKARHESAVEAGARLRQRGHTRLASEIERATAFVPTHLLACTECHRPIPMCTCVDADGKPLDWGLK